MYFESLRRCWCFVLLGALTVMSSPSYAELRSSGMNGEQTFKRPQVVALVQAIEREDLPGIDQALQRGADINAVGEMKQTPLHWSLLKVGITVKTIQHLLDRGANPNAPMDHGLTPLYLTAGGNRSDLLELFLKNGGNTNVSSRSGRTPLMEAIASQYEVNVRLLLNHGADPNFGDACSSTVANSRFDFTVELLKNGLTKNLSWCGRLIQRSVIPKNSPQQAWRTKVFEILAERGVVPPFNDKPGELEPVKPEPNR